MKHPCKKDFGQKKFFVMFSALQNVAFSTSSGECYKGQKVTWRSCDVRSCVAILLVDSKKRTVFVESFRGRNPWKNKLHERFLNTGHIVSYFPQKSCHQGEMAEICAETVVWTSMLRLHVQRCVSWHFENACSIGPPFLEVHTFRAKLKKSS